MEDWHPVYGEGKRQKAKVLLALSLFLYLCSDR